LHLIYPSCHLKHMAPWDYQPQHIGEFPHTVAVIRIFTKYGQGIEGTSYRPFCGQMNLFFSKIALIEGEFLIPPIKINPIFEWFFIYKPSIILSKNLYNILRKTNPGIMRRNHYIG